MGNHRHRTTRRPAKLSGKATWATPGSTISSTTLHLLRGSKMKLNRKTENLKTNWSKNKRRRRRRNSWSWVTERTKGMNVKRDGKYGTSWNFGCCSRFANKFRCKLNNTSNKYNICENFFITSKLWEILFDSGGRCAVGWLSDKKTMI